MPWETPTLKEVRSLVRDSIHGSLPGSDATVPNSDLRVISDTQGALCFLTLEYVDWLALQLMPDTSEEEWLDRHGNIWLINADGTTGRKQATLATGSVAATGFNGSVIPSGSLIGLSSTNAGYQTTAQVVVGLGPTTVPVTALNAGITGNLDEETTMSFTSAPPGVDQTVTVIVMDGGTDTETDDELRSRVLRRIQNPPMGGDAEDYVQWALAVPGVTRAWSFPQEQGAGTMTVRFLMDDLRANDNGWPISSDIATVQAYIEKMRPVTVKDCFVVAPVKQFIDVLISNLVPNTPDVQAEVQLSLENMMMVKASPGQTIYSAWISAAIMNAPDIQSFELITADDYVMPSPGYMAVLGTILYE
jgi:uncharacterized phage protein gp47/JayE